MLKEKLHQSKTSSKVDCLSAGTATRIGRACDCVRAASLQAAYLIMLNYSERIVYSDNGASRILEKTDNTVCSETLEGTGADAD